LKFELERVNCTTSKEARVVILKTDKNFTEIIN